MPPKQTISLFIAMIIGFTMTRHCNGAAEQRSIQRRFSTSDMSQVKNTSTSTKIPQFTRRGSTSPVPSHTPLTTSPQRALVRPQSKTTSPILGALTQPHSPPLLSLGQRDSSLTSVSKRRPSDTDALGSLSDIMTLQTLSSAAAAATSTALDSREDNDAQDEPENLPTLSTLLADALTSLQQLDSNKADTPYSIAQADTKEAEDTQENITQALTKLEHMITENNENLSVVAGGLHEEKERVNRGLSVLVKTAVSATTIMGAYFAYSYYRSKQETLRKIRMITGFEIPVALSAFKTISAPLMTALVAGIGWWRFKNSITRPLQRKFEQKVEAQNQQISSLAAKQKETAAQILLVFAAIKKAQKTLNERNMEYLGQITGLRLELENTRTVTEEMKQTIKRIQPAIEAMAQTVQKLALTDGTKKGGLFGKKNKQT